MVYLFLLLSSILNSHLIKSKEEILDNNTTEKLDENIPYSTIYRIEKPYLDISFDKSEEQ